MRMVPMKTMTTTALMAMVAMGCLTAASSNADDRGFRHYLGQRYELLSLDEDQGMDIEDSEYLRGAQANALSGGVLLPHPLDNVRIVSSAPGELEKGRTFLMTVADNGAAEKMPGAYARALSSYDCWVEQQEAEPNASHNMQNCRAIFMRNAKQLESLNQTAQHETQTIAVVENLRTLHSVHFGFDRSDLSADAKSKLDAARSMLTDANNGKLIIRGFADASGKADYNMRLSERRANTVATYLGLPADRFEVRSIGYGETHLHVPTADGVRERANRVVDISVNANKVSEGVVDTTTSPTSGQ